MALAKKVKALDKSNGIHKKRPVSTMQMQIVREKHE
jgi:hypothetical protein